jgi:hypothetical protein
MVDTCTGSRPRLDGGVGAGCRHTSQSRSRTRLRWWEACNSKRSCLDRGGGCRSPPHHTEQLSDSPATVGGAHRLALVLDGGGYLWPPHLAKPFPDSLAMVGGRHRQASARAPVAATPRGAHDEDAARNLPREEAEQQGGCHAGRWACGRQLWRQGEVEPTRVRVSSQDVVPRTLSG